MASNRTTSSNSTIVYKHRPEESRKRTARVAPNHKKNKREGDVSRLWFTSLHCSTANSHCADGIRSFSSVNWSGYCASRCLCRYRDRQPSLSRNRRWSPRLAIAGRRGGRVYRPLASAGASHLECLRRLGPLYSRTGTSIHQSCPGHLWMRSQHR